MLLTAWRKASQVAAEKRIWDSTTYRLLDRPDILRIEGTLCTETRPIDEREDKMVYQRKREEISVRK